jgi:pimeloyl-ACP methyl ester carboxylesterase
MTNEAIQRQELRVQGKPARVWVGGAGNALLLVHGGFIGAKVHWSPVWERLAQRHRVIAPDLPGLGWMEQPALVSVGEYAAWIVALLDVLDVRRAWCVGNSFGVSVVWSLAGRFPLRCAGLVAVNGFPMPKTPAPLLWLGRTTPGRSLMRAILKRVSYNSDALGRAFANSDRIPVELRETIGRNDRVLLANFANILIEGDGSLMPHAPILILFGDKDRLPGTRVRDAQKLHASNPGSTLRLIENAGHFPQLEAPETFVETLEAFINKR